MAHLIAVQQMPRRTSQCWGLGEDLVTMNIPNVRDNKTSIILILNSLYKLFQIIIRQQFQSGLKTHLFKRAYL